MATWRSVATGLRSQSAAISRPEPALGEDRGVDPAGELAQLGHRDRQLLGERVDLGQQAGLLDARAHDAQLQREPHELLLGPVVEVALQAAAGGVGGLDDAQAGDAQLLQPRPQVRLQALVVDRHRRSGGRGVDQLGTGVQRGVVDDRRDPPAVAVHGRPGAAAAGLGQGDRLAALVDEARAVGQPVGDRDRLVAQALGEHLAHRARGRRAREQERAADGAQHGVERVEARDPEHGGRQRERAERDAERRAERPRSEVVEAAEPADPLHGQLDEEGEQDDRHEGERQREDGQRRAQGEGGGEAPERAVRQQGERPAPRAAAACARRGRQRGDVRLEEAVGGPAVEAGQRGARGGPPDQQRQADGGDAEHRADQHDRDGEHPEHRDRDAHREVAEDPSGAPEALVEVEGGEAHCSALSRVTSPLVLSTWIVYGASSAPMTPRTRRRPDVVSTSTR